MIRLSQKGGGSILSYEGIYCYAYPDPGTGREPWTIGGGHTSAAGAPRVVPGLVWSIPKCLEVFMADMEKSVSRVTGTIKRRATQQVVDGFTSFDFNTGAIKSGSVDEKWNAGDEAGALRTLNLYVNAGGRRMQGLVNRRASETRIIRDGIYPRAMVTVRTSPNAVPRVMAAEDLPWPGKPTVPVTADIPVIPPLPQRKEPDNFFVRLIQWLWGKLK